MILYCSGSTTTGSQSIQDGRAHPLLLVYDKTNSRVKAYSDLEAVTGTFHKTVIRNSTTASFFWGASTQHNPGSGQNPGNAIAASGNFIWAAACTGSTAEQFSDDGKASKFLKDLGWTVSW